MSRSFDPRELREVLDNVEEADLVRIRAREGITQEELATRLGAGQPSVSRLERRGDMRVSTLRKLVEGLGGELHLLATFAEKAVRVGGLGTSRPPPSGGRDTARHDDQDSVEDRLRRFFRPGEPPGVTSVYLFGSVAAGREHAESDVDVAVLLDRGRYPAAESRADLRIELGSALVHALRRNEVDLVILNEAPPELARHVVTEGRRVACFDEAADHAFVRDAQLRAADLAPFLARMRRIKLEALAADRGSSSSTSRGS